MCASMDDTSPYLNVAFFRPEQAELQLPVLFCINEELVENQWVGEMRKTPNKHMQILNAHFQVVGARAELTPR